MNSLTHTMCTEVILPQALNKICFSINQNLNSLPKSENLIMSDQVLNNLVQVT